MKNLKEMLGVFGIKSTFQETHSCCGGHGHSHQGNSTSNIGKAYQCPMKCERDKTYDSPGKCPVCNMNLVPIS